MVSAATETISRAKLLHPCSCALMQAVLPDNCLFSAAAGARGTCLEHQDTPLRPPEPEPACRCGAASNERHEPTVGKRAAWLQGGGGGGQHPPHMHPLNSKHDPVPSGKAAYGSKEPVTQAAEANHRKICDIHVLEQVHAFAGTCMNSATRRIQCMQSCRRTWLAQRARSDGRMDAHQIVVSGSSVALVAYTMQQQRCNCHKYVAAELPNEGATADLQHSNLWP
jgi:hypothetical protein